MSFDSHSELQPHLLALAQIAQWHANAHQLPLELRFAVHEGAADTVHTAITGVIEAQAPDSYTQAVTAAVMNLARTEKFFGSFTVRINVSPGGQAIVKQTPLMGDQAQEQQAPTTAQARQTVILAEGLHLRSALLERGHTSGYSAEEITAEERKRGFTFPPELKFYRTLVREGVITQVEGKDVRASNLQADFGESILGAGPRSQTDFGESSLHKVPWKAPSANTVQATLNHHLWVEIAHSDSHLYAFDMAPGPAGTPGQIIARRIGDASVPVRIASSLAHFITGENLSSQVVAQPPETPRPTAPLGETIAWVGTVDPVAVPAPLGWSEIPAKTQHHKDQRALGSAGSSNTQADQNRVAAHAPVQLPPALSKNATAVAPNTSKATPALFAKGPALSNRPPLPTADTELIPRYRPHSNRPANPDNKLSGLSTPADTPKDASQRVHRARPIGQEKQGKSHVTGEVQFQKLDSPTETDVENLTSGILYTPISPEQKNIATTMGTLAFGTKEEREEYRAKDTNPIPALDTRGKKLSLTSASPGELAAQREDKQVENNLRAALRRLFSGGNQR